MIKYIITDFDGTLVDTKEANVLAYKDAFKQCGYTFDNNLYSSAFGLNFSDMCDKLNIDKNINIRNEIKKLKQKIYPKYFNNVSLNKSLFEFIKYMKHYNNIKTAIASTASKGNLYNLLDFFKIKQYWDVIITNDDVNNGKPNPEVYNITKKCLCVKNNDEVLVFEDSYYGVLAAQTAGIDNIIKVS